MSKSSWYKIPPFVTKRNGEHTIPWRRHALKPANEPVQLRIFLLPYLKDTVKKKRMMEGANVPCVQEMTVMLSCLKDNEFDQSKCEKLITSFNTCVQNSKIKREKEVEIQKKGIIDSSSRRHDPRALNAFLAKYPLPRGDPNRLPPKYRKPGSTS